MRSAGEIKGNRNTEGKAFPNSGLSLQEHLNLLQAELNSLQGVTMDSTKLLTEKLTLARELSSLRPETNHLRTQAASHQSLLSEKLALQRELSATQVDLETEKRSTQRAQTKAEKLHAEDANLESMIEMLQADLARERSERQKVEREVQKTSVESEKRKIMLESRLDAFRTKLRTTKEQLKEAHSALEGAQAANKSRGSISIKPNALQAENPRKRAAVQMDADTMIGTPGDNPAAKRNKIAPTLVGEKSTFSITPFLNRAASVPLESPPLYSNGSVVAGEAEATDHVPDDRNPEQIPGETGPIARTLALSNNALQAEKGGILNAGKVNSKRTQARKAKATSVLEQVAEEEQTERDKMPAPEAAGSKVLSNDVANAGIEMKKKKRKLLGDGLGKTLFDEDDGEVGKGDSGSIRNTKGFASLGRGGLGVSEVGSKKAFSSNIGSFGAISPRKGR